MTLKDFIDYLGENEGMELVFNFNGENIKKDYHITEILKNSVMAIDCGGKLDRWEETVFQLIEPRNENKERFMSVEKANKILKKSSEKINFDQNSKVILEFKPVGSFAAQRFNLSEVQIRGDQLLVLSSGAASTQCKALARKYKNKTSSCCESASSEASSKCCA
ncbi:MAG: DUF6428 family protein [Bdellovibrionales bacterium]